ncbi:biotin transporter BioY [Aquibacillus kalidii]|uniref:biotin transporter BioY n=1 Tax=Aquibacillus kalidii TaxID=2762597 RepID=UPI002E29BE1D|nr:biotin transporter BioY [Aquibacillus kalidii]
MKLKAIDITLAAMFAALMAVGSNITSFIIIGGVPITLTTFLCVMAGLILGSRLGALSMTVYTLIGLVGAPVFANFTGGPSVLVKPTFGFVLSYILVAYVVGKIVEKKSSKKMFLFAALIGLVINYFVGTNWMYYAYKFWASAPEGFTYKMAWAWMVAPLPKDIIFTIIAGVMAPRIQKVVSKSYIGKRSVA